MALSPDPGSSVADTYATLSEFKSHLGIKLPPVVWTLGDGDPILALDAGDPFLEGSLKLSAILLDRSFDWNGLPSFPGQARAFPRSGLFNGNGEALDPLTNPPEIKLAQMEWAAQLGSTDFFSENIAARLGVSLVKAGSVQVEFHENRSAIDYMKLSSQAARYLLVPAIVRLMLVPSWYQEQAIARRQVRLRVL